MKMLFLGVFVGLSVGAVATSFVVLRPSQAAPHFKCAIMVTTVEEAARLDATAHTLDLTGSVLWTSAPYPTSSEATTKVGLLRCPLGLHPATGRWSNGKPGRSSRFQ